MRQHGGQRAGAAEVAPLEVTTLEAFDRPKGCPFSEDAIIDTTFHARHNGFDDGVHWATYTITANGCGSAENDGTTFGIRADGHSEVF